MMIDDFEPFHDADNCCLHKQFTIFLYVTLRGLLLLFQLSLHGNVDVNSQLLAANQNQDNWLVIRGKLKCVCTSHI
jgi:hypothetical protein